ncbi:MAG: ABC transporter permease [Candidatus Binatia bacterium]
MILLPVFSLARRELVRFVRQRNRVFGALAQPVIFWLIFGSGLSASFRPGGGGDRIGYMEYFFPGTVVLILLFTAIFATISIIEDRNEGFMQSVLVAPVPVSTVVFGKLVGTTALAVGQGLLMLLLAPLAGIPLGIEGFFLSTALMIVIALGLTALGFCIAWNMDSAQGFHAVMTAFLMPMWFLSGAFFPSEGLPPWLHLIVTLNPLTYGVSALRSAMYASGSPALSGLPPIALSLGILCLFSAATCLLALRIAERKPAGPAI